MKYVRDWMVPQSKPSIDKHQRESQRCRNNQQPNEPMCEAPMIFQIGCGGALKPHQNVDIREIRRYYQSGCGERGDALQTAFCEGEPEECMRQIFHLEKEVRSVAMLVAGARLDYGSTGMGVTGNSFRRSGARA